MRNGLCERTGTLHLSGHLKRLLVALACLGPIVIGSGPALGGSGQVNNDGTIDITVNFRFPPTAGDLANFQAQVISASQVLWDASEGQLRFGDVTITCGSVDEDLADMWVFANSGRAGTSLACPVDCAGALGAAFSQSANVDKMYSASSCPTP